MRCQQVLRVGIAAVLVILFLVGCGGNAPTAVSEAPAGTSVPEQAVATQTPEPPTPIPVPPTETPDPSFANPQPGATFTGKLKSSEGTGSGTINFKVLDDGNSIAEVEIKLIKTVVCSGGSRVGELTQNLKGPFAVTASNIDSGDKKLKGKFTSPTEANGTIDIFIKSTGCDFGTWNWSAKAK